jgi:hypothetical protein
VIASDQIREANAEKPQDQGEPDCIEHQLDSENALTPSLPHTPIRPRPVPDRPIADAKAALDKKSTRRSYRRNQKSIKTIIAPALGRRNNNKVKIPTWSYSMIFDFVLTRSVWIFYPVPDTLASISEVPVLSRRPGNSRAYCANIFHACWYPP